MSNKFYMIIEGIKGPVQVAGFTGAFELDEFNDIGIRNPFAADNGNGQSYGGVPDISPIAVTLNNVKGSVSCKLMKEVLDATSLKSVTVYEIAKLKGKETSTYDITLNNPHILSYERHSSSGDEDGAQISLVLGNLSSIMVNHVDIDGEGATTQFKVKYDLQKQITS